MATSKYITLEYELLILPLLSFSKTKNLTSPLPPFPVPPRSLLHQVELPYYSTYYITKINNRDQWREWNMKYGGRGKNKY